VQLTSDNAPMAAADFCCCSLSNPPLSTPPPPQALLACPAPMSCPRLPLMPASPLLSRMCPPVVAHGWAASSSLPWSSASLLTSWWQSWA
jgi:hypothetical protein